MGHCFGLGVLPAFISVSTVRQPTLSPSPTDISEYLFIGVVDGAGGGQLEMPLARSAYGLGANQTAALLSNAARGEVKREREPAKRA